jgi:hypothetical protein
LWDEVDVLMGTLFWKRQGFAGKMAGVNLAFVVTITAAGFAFLILNQKTLVTSDLIGRMGGWIFALGSAAIGLLIIRRHPRHLVGWLFCYLALPMVIFGFSSEYAVYGLVLSQPPLPGAYFMGWLQNWVIYLAFPAALALPYLFFPDGKLLSPRWRPAVWLAVAATILGVASTMINPGQMAVFRTIGNVMLPMTNITGIENQNSILVFFGGSSWVGGIFVLLAAMVSLILRYRISRGAPRQQLKWFAYLTIIVLLGFMLSDFLIPGQLGEIVSSVWIAVLLLSVPAAVGIAILRYQLYDIDLIIKRTLLYGLLTGSLTAIYFLSVIALQRIIPVQSQLAIVLSTLLIAFLFNPLKTRFQRFIDRRFFRQRYDPEQVLADFAGSIRDEVDPGALSQDLVDVVQDTLQPEHVSLWVRDSE